MELPPNPPRAPNGFPAAPPLANAFILGPAVIFCPFSCCFANSSGDGLNGFLAPVFCGTSAGAGAGCGAATVGAGERLDESGGSFVVFVVEVKAEEEGIVPS